MNKNIKSVVKNDLCNGCGTCISLCPVGAIELDINKEKGIYIPKIDEKKCNNCGICFSSCPKTFDNLAFLNQIILGKTLQNTLIGNYFSCYFGYAKNYSIRYNSASGGVVTSLLVFALQKKIIDGALVVRMKKDNPLRPEPFIARTKEEIIEARGSKYCPVPINIVLREILKSKPKERFAVVGLPCHILGIRKAEEVSKELKEKIILHFGLFCHHVPNFHATEIFSEKFNIKKDEIIKLDYRGGGWPGYTKILRKNEKTTIPSPTCWKFIGSNFFISRGCLTCVDQTAELSDISFGDPWLPELEKEKVGKSIIISRNEIGEEILKKAQKEGIIQLKPISCKKVVLSQITSLYFKKKIIVALTRLFWKKTFFNNTLEPDLLDYPLAILFWISATFFQIKIFRRLVRYIPFKIFYFFNKIINFIYYKKSHHDLRQYGK